MAQFLMNSGVMPTTAPVIKVALVGAAIKTVLQALTPATMDMRIFAWGVSFDGVSSAATPVQCELVTTAAVAATVTQQTSTGIFTFNEASAPTSGLTLGTAATGFNASAEGSVAAVRYGDQQLVSPTSGYSMEWADGREFYVPASTVLRVRCLAAANVNCTAWIRWRE